MKKKLNAQLPYLVIIAVVAIIAVAVIIFSSRSTLVVDEEGNIIGEGVAGLRTTRTPTRGGPTPGYGTINPATPTVSALPNQEALSVSCGTGSRQVLIDLSEITGGSTDPKEQEMEERYCCTKCQADENGMCTGITVIKCGSTPC